jgi:hypothetical protein
MSTNSSTPPAGMVVVTKEQFFAFIYADKRDIMPQSERTHSRWEQVHTRALIGYTDKGYASPYGHVETFMLTEAAAASVKLAACKS